MFSREDLKKSAEAIILGDAVDKLSSLGLSYLEIRQALGRMNMCIKLRESDLEVKKLIKSMTEAASSE